MGVEAWGFGRGPGNELVIGGVGAVDLARRYGTPLHVVDEDMLRRRARALRTAFEAHYPAVEVFYALKCNSTAEVVRCVVGEGLGVEVMSEFELWLARRLGLPPDRIVLNGPNKGEGLLREALARGVGAVGVDSLGELARLEAAAEEAGAAPRVLLRVNPDIVPRGMNSASATGSRRGSVFGLDLRGGELPIAFERLRRSRTLRYAGFHAHIGTGIRRPEDYERAFRRIAPALLQARAAGLETAAFDFGGGFGVATSREFTTWEFLTYQGWGRLPRLQVRAADFAAPICAALTGFCAREGLPLPTLYLEPGRAIAGPAQVLLLTVGAVKDRRGVGRWVITDGGAGTCAFPLYYECHEVLLAGDVDAPFADPVRMVGPVCFASNWIYRRKRMPALQPGDVLAVMDAGAYFLALEANFGFPRPPVVMVSDGAARLIRRRETFEDMIGREACEEFRYADVAAGHRS